MTFFPQDFGRGDTLYVGALLRALVADAKITDAFHDFGKDSKEFRKANHTARKANEQLGFWTLCEVEQAIVAHDKMHAEYKRQKAKKPAKVATKATRKGKKK